ncbi:hypothetical protein [Undibacterium sp. RuTC16W]|uniref:hypothetical protein n=1 Tax=Undibacterium sp. RuTC16W TaxID=3413048 RepID=UPI003BF39134
MNTATATRSSYHAHQANQAQRLPLVKRMVLIIKTSLTVVLGILTAVLMSIILLSYPSSQASGDQADTLLCRVVQAVSINHDCDQCEWRGTWDANIFKLRINIELAQQCRFFLHLDSSRLAQIITTSNLSANSVADTVRTDRTPRTVIVKTKNLSKSMT